MRLLGGVSFGALFFLWLPEQNSEQVCIGGMQQGRDVLAWDLLDVEFIRTGDPSYAAPTGRGVIDERLQSKSGATKVIIRLKPQI